MAGDISLPDKVEPLDDEHVLDRRWANRTQHARRAVGGRLYLTNRRLVFAPHAVDAALAGEWWWAPLDAITSVGRQKRDWSQYMAGGLRTRLRIDLHDGSTELFFVNKLDQVVEQIKEAAQAS